MRTNLALISLSAISLLTSLVSGCTPLSSEQVDTLAVAKSSIPQKQEQPKPEPYYIPSGPPNPGPLQLLSTPSPMGCCASPQLGLDQQLWGWLNQSGDRQNLIQAIDNSLIYLNSARAVKDYQRYQKKFPAISLNRVRKSLQRFRQLVIESKSAAQLQAAVQREFVFYQSVGNDGWGKVLFSAYYEPIYEASRVQTPEYRYPIYRIPPNLDNWSWPHPTRKQLEGEDGLQAPKSRLAGLELFWLKDRWQAYQIHIQGSAKLRLPDGSLTSVNYAGNTRRNYVSIGWELSEDGKMELEKVTMPAIREYFRQHPEEENDYMSRDNSFVFFKESGGRPAQGSISVPLSAERSIATDKSLMPPGALALINTSIPTFNNAGDLKDLPISRYVLDQDAGGAIKTPGRVDYFLGTGDEPEQRAGVTRSYGQLYYLLLKE